MNCQRCAICCHANGPIPPLGVPEKAPAWLRQLVNALRASPFAEADRQGVPCLMLWGKTCLIYADRPRVCREYACDKMQSRQGRPALRSSLPTVPKRAGRWPEAGWPRVYVGKARPAWHGRHCRILATWRGRAPHNVRIEFLNGRRAVVPMRCLRRSLWVPGQKSL